jgi:hypothetical protein
MLTLILLAPLALADLGPSWTEVERCTRGVEEREGRECRTCGRVTKLDPLGCERALAHEGYVRACKTANERVWTEVWCRAAPLPPPPPDAPKGAFGTVGVGVGGGGFGPPKQEDEANWVRPVPAPAVVPAAEPAAEPTAAEPPAPAPEADAPAAEAPAPSASRGLGCATSGSGLPSGLALTGAMLALRRRQRR